MKVVGSETSPPSPGWKIGNFDLAYFVERLDLIESHHSPAERITRSCNPLMALAAMHSGVPCRAKRNQVLLGVFPRMAAEFPVVHLKIRHRATGLTPPAVATQESTGAAKVRQTDQDRPSVITSKAANGSSRCGTQLFYPAASCGGKSVLVLQLRGPHLSTCPWCNRRSRMRARSRTSSSIS